jgi:RNA polymerase sigma factor (sigma-70 family)
MDEDRDWLAERFAAQRGQLRAVAYRMLGSLDEADDALQEAWLRADRAGADGVDNIGGWLTTIVARVCLNLLRSRSARGEDRLDARLPDPIVDPEPAADPEHGVLVEDAVGLALLVVLDTLSPAERLAFVLHDTFAVPFEDIATVLDRSPGAARQLASRARRRVQGARATPDADLARQRAVVDAFFAAARDGDFDALLAVLDPDVVVRSDTGSGTMEVLRGAATVGAQAFAYRGSAPFAHPALVNGAAGAVVVPDGRLTLVMAFTVRDGRVVAIDGLADPARLARLDLSSLLP